MKKKSAIAKLTIIIVFTLIGAFLSLICFNIPFSNTKWNSFVGGLNFGNDVSQGIVASYDIAVIDSDESIDNVANNTRQKIYDTLSKYYTEPSVALVGNSMLNIQIGSEENYSDDNRIELVLSQIGQQTSFKVYDEDEASILTLSQVQELTYEKIAGTETLVIKFNKAGSKVLEQISSDCYTYGKNMIIRFTEDNKIESVPDQEILDGKLYMSGGLSKSAIVAQIINLQCEDARSTLTYKHAKVTTANLGEGFDLAFLIVLLTFVVLVWIGLCIKYKLFGVMLMISNLMFLAIYSLFLNILPGIQITVGSFVGVALSVVIMIFSMIGLCEQIKIENKNGKKIKTAFDFGFKKVMKIILDATFVVLIPSFILIFVGSNSINNFAVAFCVGLLVNMFIILVLTREIFKCSIKLWGKKPKAFNLKQEVLDNEKI